MSKLITSVAFGLFLLGSSVAVAGERTVTLAVQNMYCDACPLTVKKSLQAVPGVAKTVVSYKNKTAIVGQIRDEARARHIESAGSMAQAALAKLNLENAQQASTLRTQLAEARASGNEDAVQSIQQQISDLAFTGKDTAAAYRTYSTASQKLLDLEVKLADPLFAGQAATIKGEIEEAKMMQRQAAKDLGVKMPDAKAAQFPTPPQAALDALAKNPDKRAAFIAKYGEAALPTAAPPAKQTGGIIGSGGPKEGDTRTVAVGRGQGQRTQVYTRVGRSGVAMDWVDQ